MNYHFYSGELILLGYCISGTSNEAIEVIFMLNFLWLFAIMRFDRTTTSAIHSFFPTLTS